MLDEPRLLAASPWVAHRPITVTGYHRMREAGILSERDRVELIEGEFSPLSPINSDHCDTVIALARSLAHTATDRAIVSMHSPTRGVHIQLSTLFR